MTTTNATSIVDFELRQFIENRIRNRKQELDHFKSIVNSPEALEETGITKDQCIYFIESYKQQIAAWNEKLNG